MLVVISPAKTLDFNKTNETLPMTSPKFLKEARTLVDELKKYDSYSLGNLMKTSDKLSLLNKDRFEVWNESFDNARQCLIAFKGEVFRGIDVGSFNIEDLFYTNEHLRILSGLYGVLSPFDGVNPYRLEMGTKLSFDNYKNLYDYWEDKLKHKIIEDIKSTGNNILVNLASYEYFKSIEGIDILDTSVNIVTPIFKEYRNGEYKIITMKAKKARGLMTSFIMKNKINNINDLKKFDLEGYLYNEQLSNNNDLVFTLEN
ncbi:MULTISPECIES: peroxide stress protein YaaA [unclassified Clostridium]|uniref:peroxide stress protein YaaA n=1 Tax=unclassified Clostridium TaxID=2614128 RepID=UPI0013F026F7|nr:MULTISPECIES: peroxide stress protein YaaA [unclassified Clostridium]NFG62203.1 peroxide stress protein YaaA [Clostridium botulinum]NFQ09555.1 peroxide stress protein YaaA [Clostridium botulinum]